MRTPCWTGRCGHRDCVDAAMDRAAEQADLDANERDDAMGDRLADMEERRREQEWAAW